jgi:hypothetical protein
MNGPTNTLAAQFTRRPAALALECAVQDGRAELKRGAGPRGADLYVFRTLPPRTPLRPPIRSKT